MTNFYEPSLYMKMLEEIALTNYHKEIRLIARVRLENITLAEKMVAELREAGVDAYILWATETRVWIRFPREQMELARPVLIKYNIYTSETSPEKRLEPKSSEDIEKAIEDIAKQFGMTSEQVKKILGRKR